MGGRLLWAFNAWLRVCTLSWRPVKDLRQEGHCQDSALSRSLQQQRGGWIWGKKNSSKAIQAGKVGGLPLNHGRERSGVGRGRGCEDTAEVAI